MARAAYSRGKCWVCGKSISSAGAALVAHMRKHVREGKVEEIKETPYGGYSFRRKESK